MPGRRMACRSGNPRLVAPPKAGYTHIRVDQSGRFQRNQELRHDGQVVTSMGVDVVTGLSVLIYDFPGEPLLSQGSLDLEGVPTVLASWTEGEKGTLVAAYPSGSTLVAPGEAVVDDQFVLQTLTLLRDAARKGLAHGGIGPGRFLRAGKRLYLEGYGVPWRAGTPPAPASGQVTPNPALDAALRADLTDGVKALLELGAQGISTEVAAALRASVTGKNATDVAALQATVRRLAGGAVTVPSAGFVDIVLPTTPESTSVGRGPLDLESLEFTPVPRAPEAGIDYDPHDVAGTMGASPSVSATRTDMRVDPDELKPRPSSPQPPPGAAKRQESPLEPDPITLVSDPGGGTLRTGKPDHKASDPGFVKHLPPGATYRAGSLDDAPRPAPIRIDDDADDQVSHRAWRGPGLLVLLVLVVALGIFLALRAQRNSTLSQVSPSTVSHLVDVRVSPGNLPPVSLVVDRSPDGSRYPRGTIIGTVPRRVGFDAAGTWVVHGLFQGRSSEPVTLQVPDDTVITVVFPETPPETP